MSTSTPTLQKLQLEQELAKEITYLRVFEHLLEQDTDRTDEMQAMIEGTRMNIASIQKELAELK